MKISMYWLALTIPVLIAAIWLLARSVGSLVRAIREATILAVPLAPSQPVVFPESGVVDLYLEGKRGANLAGLDFELEDASGQRVELEGATVRTTVSGLSRVRVKVRSFHLPHDGPFTLGISGLRPELDRETRIVFARPVGGIILGHVLALVGLGFLAIGSIVGSIFVLIPRR